MRHVVVFVLIMSIIGSFQLFELPLAMFHETHGLGPENSAITLITYLNRVAFESGDLGLGSAVGWVVTIIIMAVSLVQLQVTAATKD
jgi:ABC-type sugar transport system permease subunit